MPSIKLGEVEIGPGHPPYVIAEIGSNHNGDMDLCFQLIDAAAGAGAHAVKFQSWTEESLIAEVEYARNTSYGDRKKHFGSLRDMVKAYQFTPEQHRLAHDRSAERGIAFCSTPFSCAEADMLAQLDVPFYKIASMDIVHLPLLRHIARKGRPLVLSTGMATLGEIERAIMTVRAEGNDQIVLLHCVSLYPPRIDQINLRNITMLQQAFGVPAGFSDHTLGTAIALAAVALGACIIEKHFTLDKDMPGWDHAVSADPIELRAIVEAGGSIQSALGVRHRVVSPAEMAKREQFRRSIVAQRDLPSGHTLQEADLTAKRPGTGIAPDELDHVLGRTLKRDLACDDLLSWEDLQ
jgi:N,N'-diacetyllegionaminate synthase